MKARLLGVWSKVYRLWVAIGLLSVLGVATLPQLGEQSKLALVVYKISLITIFWILWHVLLHNTFDYFHFRDMLRDKDTNAVAVAVVIAATCLAVVLGGMLGL
jgi:hypothetical protein